MNATGSWQTSSPPRGNLPLLVMDGDDFIVYEWDSVRRKWCVNGEYSTDEDPTLWAVINTPNAKEIDEE